MSRAWSIGKTDRCKLFFETSYKNYEPETSSSKILNQSYNHIPILPPFLIYNFQNSQFYSILVQITAEIKKNRFMANVGPDSYDMSIKNKRAEPKWT